jgi:hypothetical protein
MIKRNVKGCQVELKIAAVGSGSHGQARNPQATGKSDESLLARIHTEFYDFLDDRTEEPVLLLEAALILCQEPVEVMKQHPIEDSLLGRRGR